MPYTVGGIYHFNASAEGISDNGYPPYPPGNDEDFAGMVIFNRSELQGHPSSLVAVTPVVMRIPYDSQNLSELVLWRDFEFATGYVTNTELMDRYPHVQLPETLTSFIAENVSGDNLGEMSFGELFSSVGLSAWWVNSEVQADARFFGMGVSASSKNRPSPLRIRQIPKSKSMFKVNKKGV
jgi:hypothetical protein